MKKHEDFSEWYNEAIEKADLTDKRYPVKGMNIWRPYGWKLMRLIDGFTRELVEDTGHDEVKFPLLIPEDEFKKEADHIKGFDEQVFWVSHAGRNELEIPLLLRPTSETAMYPVFDLWVRSHADLPLKIYQIVNVFRYETKQTRAFMRMREIHFFEAHTCHGSNEDAEDQIREDFVIMDKLSKKLCMPYLKLQRTDWDKFPGADYSVGADALMPTGKLLQVAGIHQYKTNFAKAYDITFETQDGDHKHVFQTTYGMSERLIGAIVAIHGDDKGIVLPPAVAPIQARIIPIAYGEDEELMKYCEKLKSQLVADGLRVDMDSREDIRPGSKFFECEQKGIPMRLDIGRNEMEQNTVTIVRRDTGNKETVSTVEIAQQLKDLSAKMENEMYERANNVLKESILDVKDFEDMTEQKIYRIGWCGELECGQYIEEVSDREILGSLYGEEDNHECQCLSCGKPTTKPVYLCKTH